MLKRRFTQPLVAALLLVTMLSQGTWVLAGTTGGLSGTVVEADSTTPIIGAKVTAASPSQVISTETKEGGNFTFLSLAPDTYTVSVEKKGYEPTSQQGITIVADQTRTLSLSTKRSLREIGRITSRSSSELVKPGTTSDVYSVNAAVAEKAGVLGGGGNANNAYSALAAVPGAVVPYGGQGYGNAVLIRGGDFDQVGYEYDGVPVNRSFDNYAGGGLSNLGQQELQLYTGGTPAGASAAGIAGFINQVIRTGTYPGFATIDMGIGGPTFYHKLNVEIGGATPNRNFSYYVGVGGSNNAYRLYDQFNGGGPNFNTGFLTLLNVPQNTSDNGLPTAVAPQCVAGNHPSLLPVGSPGYQPLPAGVANNPGCYAYGPGQIFNGANVSPSAGGGALSDLADREGVVNLHFGLPHHHDGGKDDIQLLYSGTALFSKNYGSINDLDPTTFFNAYGVTGLNYIDPVIFAPGTTFGQPASTVVKTTYFQPSSPVNRPANGPINPITRDGFTNDQQIFKAQYQKNIGSNAYVRLFGYTFYSDWLINGPNYNGLFRPTALDANFGNIGPLYGNSPDYELSTHTRGFELQIADQISPKHLLNGTFNYTTASTVRFNNTTFVDAFGTGSRATNYTDFNQCFDKTGQPAPCNRQSGGASNPSYGTFKKPIPFPLAPAGTPAANAGANWYVTKTGLNGSLNTVVPKFSSVAISDQFKPTDRLLLNLGLRFERFEFDLPSTAGPARDFWFKAAQREFCYDPVTLLPALVPGTTRPLPTLGACPGTDVHPDGLNGHLLFSNNYDHTMVNTVTSPRLAGTYTLSSDTVVRASYGRYSQPISTAFTQYNRAEENLPPFLFNKFWKYGFTTPRHDVVPSVSDNLDVSLERHIRGTDVNFKLTPFLRSTKDQSQLFYLDPTTGFVSGLNVGQQRSTGVEFQLTKGDFNRDGWSGQLAYTYTDSKIKYNNFRNTSRNVIDVLNDSVKQYNAFTSFCGTNPTSALCGSNTATGAPIVASPCYANSGDGTPDPACGATSIANPYYNLAPQPLFDRNGSYVPFDIFPSTPNQGNAIGSQASILYPHNFSAILNYRKNKLAITPSFQLATGAKYGVPLDVPGIDPSSCSNNSAGIATAPKPTQADYTSCAAFINIPNPQSGGRFTSLGQYNNPTQFLMNLGLTYEFTPKVKASLILANLVTQCFGGSSTPWKNQYPPGRQVCQYASNGYTGYVSPGPGGYYNGSSPNDVAANGVALNPYQAQSYQPAAFNLPFQAYLNFTIKL